MACMATMSLRAVMFVQAIPDEVTPRFMGQAHGWQLVGETFTHLTALHPEVARTLDTYALLLVERGGIEDCIPAGLMAALRATQEEHYAGWMTGPEVQA